MPLSDTACRTAKPKAKRYKLSDFDGLSLRILPQGGKYWIFRFRLKGKEKELYLGAYPTVKLAEARASRDEAKQLLKNGGDPILDKSAQKLKLKTSLQDDFESVAQEWIELKKQKLKPRYLAQIESRLRNDIFPQIGRFPCKDITPAMMLNVLRKVQARGVLETALRLKEYCSSIFHYAIVCEKAERDPTASLRDVMPTPIKQHFAAIDSSELPAMLLKMSDNTIGVGFQTRLAMRALMLTFVRTRELVEARKEEINFETARWIIPASRMKMKRDHIVPLSRQMLEIFKMLNQLSTGEYVFSGQHSQNKPMSNMTILMGLKRMGYKGKMTGHGFRALATTTLRETLGYPKELTDIQLAHAKGKTDAAYDRAQFLKERTEMMQVWADYIDKVENQAKSNQKLG